MHKHLLAGFINETLLINGRLFKGALDNFSFIPDFFFQKSRDFYTIRSVYLWSAACLIRLAASTWLPRYLIFFSCSSHFQSQLLEMTATVMTIEAIF